MIEKIKEFTCDMGMEIIMSSLQNTHDSRKIRKDIIEFVQDRQELALIDEDRFNEIDYRGYLKYIRTHMLDEIKTYICTIDYRAAEALKNTIMDKASSYERKLSYPSGTIRFITENCINIVKSYYTGRLDGKDKLLAHISVQSILNPIIPKFDKINQDVSEIKKLIAKQEGDVTLESESVSQTIFFQLVYCIQNVSYIEELKKWMECNSFNFEERCYEDENIFNEDAISYLGPNKRLILIVEESFLRNIHCVYGLSEIIKSENSKDYIFPVIVDNSVFDEISRIQCIAYWEKKEKELRTSVNNLEKVQHAYKLVSDNLVKYERTAQTIDELLVWMSKHSYNNIEQIKGVVKKKLI